MDEQEYMKWSIAIDVYLLEEEILAEIAHHKDHSIRSLFQKLRDDKQGVLRERVVKHINERLQQEQVGDSIKAIGEYKKDITNKILPKDVKECLDECLQNGDIEIENAQIRITPKGGEKLANRVKVKLERLHKARKGSHRIKKELGYGLDFALTTKKYESGDVYQSIDIQKTLLCSLERNARKRNPSRISVTREDLRVFERTYENRMCISLIIDESSSMGEDKRNTALDTFLGLKVFVYSDKAKEIPHWDILNTSLPGDTTDMRITLQTARVVLRNERLNKQVYLITDTEPNTENVKYIGFEAAILGVLREVVRYRQEGITLNIIILDDSAKPKELASHLAKINAGEVFFTSPSNLGKVVIDDYLLAGSSRGLS
ncbi:MAG: hypothetical protein SWO11_18985 [Thermodesulfobacteriota bacterium]|nr:hypothetical protein [Thermodesulfobacteriota bacterium]